VNKVAKFLVALKGGKFLYQFSGYFPEKDSGYYAIQVQETKKICKTS
jgi:hypothetical protein